MSHHDDAYCPHCQRLLLLEAPRPYPTRPLRCPSCHLVVGPGRAQDATGHVRLTIDGGRRPDAVLDVLMELQLGVRPVGGDDAGVAMER